MVERRASDRVTINFATRCRVPATPHPATLLDLSRTGCRMHLPAVHVTPGTTVHVDLAPSQSVSGVIAWAGGQTAGVQFHRRLDTGVAVRMGIEQEAPEPDQAEPIAEPGTGLQHWIRAVFGFVKR